MAIRTGMPLLSVSPLLSLDAREERAAIFETVALLDGHADVRDVGKFADAVWERQKISPPLLGHGIALPHARTGSVSELVFAVSRLVEPVCFGEEETPIRLLFLFGVPPHRITEYLAATAQLVRVLRDLESSEVLLTTTNESEFLEALGTEIA